MSIKNYQKSDEIVLDRECIKWRKKIIQLLCGQANMRTAQNSQVQILTADVLEYIALLAKPKIIHSTNFPNLCMHTRLFIIRNNT